MMPMPAHPVPHDMPALDQALAQKWAYLPRTRARVRRAVHYILDALTNDREIETYAQIKFGFWYKVYFFTPHGALKSDTTGEHMDTKAFARAVIKSQDLRAVPLTAVMENWQMGTLWERSKPLSALLLRAWQARERRYMQGGTA
jgi:hypothetical protein